ncbi:MAG: 3-phosphoshikimate 1-carboxyvinyltransferase, partial [Myxococcota bacterium]|nr:3-phosphoshikimate 1-carboxyvinyltransferase [Myxococcota bacterium]
MAAPLPDPLPVRPRGPLDGRLRPPGSRSIANRALLAAALADGRSRLTGVTEMDDTRAMRE